VIDLILSTVRRTSEPRRLLDSLTAQTYPDFRLIIVDQNDDDRLVPLADEFGASLSILHLRSAPGISRARNVALPHVEADVVAFPDDDCWYPPDLLERVTALLSANQQWDGVSGRAVDADGRPSTGSDDTRPTMLTRYNLWDRVGSYRLFLRRRVIDTVGRFDEMLGVGSSGPWGGGEDLDYALRAVDAGHLLYYEPSLVVFHPRRRETGSEPDPADGYRYGMGMGRVLRTGQLPVWFAGYHCSRAFAASSISLARGRRAHARYHWAVGRGRVRGWLRSSEQVLRTTVV
jgi:glycosyltransferase involved in cell wall biosynthesis